MAIDNRYSIIDAQTYLDQGVLNVYHYKQTVGAGGSAADLLQAFVEVLWPYLFPLQSTNVVHVTATCLNLDNLDDFDIFTPVTGNTGSDTTVNPLASFYAWKFQLVRKTRASRHGWKRIAGVPEEAVVGNGVVGGYVGLANGFATVLGGDLVSDLSTYSPVILRKNVVPTLSLDFPVDHAVFRGVTTQNTRKAGRGM